MQTITRTLRLKYAIWARHTYDPTQKIKPLLEARQRQMHDSGQQRRIEAFSKEVAESCISINPQEMEEAKARVYKECRLSIAT